VLAWTQTKAAQKLQPQVPFKLLWHAALLPFYNEYRMRLYLLMNSRVVYRILIASPADVVREKAVAREIMHAWNSVHGFDEEISLEPVSWDRDAFPEVRASLGTKRRGEGVSGGQSILDEQFENCDAVVAIFWSRIGTPTGRYPGGTVQEVRRFLKAKKHVSVYFSSRPLDPKTLNKEQYEALMKFKAWLVRKGLVWTYSSINGFKDLFRDHLARIVMALREGALEADEPRREADRDNQMILQNYGKSLAHRIERMKEQAGLPKTEVYRTLLTRSGSTFADLLLKDRIWERLAKILADRSPKGRRLQALLRLLYSRPRGIRIGEMMSELRAHRANLNAVVRRPTAAPRGDLDNPYFSLLTSLVDQEIVTYANGRYRLRKEAREFFASVDRDHKSRERPR
jgi:hypothetical protein